jgi:hypothetical protein
MAKNALKTTVIFRGEIVDAYCSQYCGDDSAKILIIEATHIIDDPAIYDKADRWNNFTIEVPTTHDSKIGDRDDLVGKTLVMEIR